MKPLSFAKQLVRRLMPPVCLNVNQTQHDKKCLLLYITKPFRSDDGSIIHQNRRQVRELARTVGGFGYNVDVVDWYHTRVRLMEDYDLVIDVRPRHGPVYADHMARGGIRVALLTTSNPSVSNEAEEARLDRILQSRGVRLKPRWQMERFRRETLESCQSVWLIGNGRTLATYGEFALPPVTLVRNTGYPSLYTTDMSHRSPKSFLFLGSVGQVHKGLDLLLEVFVGLPELKLYVCGHFSAERDFCRAYNKELFRTPNIVPVGFVDVNDERFRRLAEECSFLVMASCAEGMSGSVLTGMSAGLVPIVSRECGLDDPDVHHLDECSVGCIRDTVKLMSLQPEPSIRDRSLATLDIVKTKFSPNQYTSCIEAAMRSLEAPRGSLLV